MSGIAGKRHGPTSGRGFSLLTDPFGKYHMGVTAEKVAERQGSRASVRTRSRC